MKLLLIGLISTFSLSALAKSVVDYNEVASHDGKAYELIVSGAVAKDLYDNLEVKKSYNGNKVADGIVCGKDSSGYACSLVIGKAGVHN